jgi:hypothetical protein
MLAAESTLFQQSICIIHAGIDNTSFGSAFFARELSPSPLSADHWGAIPRILDSLLPAVL